MNNGRISWLIIIMLFTGCDRDKNSKKIELSESFYTNWKQSISERKKECSNQGYRLPVSKNLIRYLNSSEITKNCNHFFDIESYSTINSHRPHFITEKHLISFGSEPEYILTRGIASEYNLRKLDTIAYSSSKWELNYEEPCKTFSYEANNTYSDVCRSRFKRQGDTLVLTKLSFSGWDSIPHHYPR